MKKVKTIKKKPSENNTKKLSKKWIIIALVVCFISILFVRFVSTANKTTPASEQNYSDPGNYYSLQFPSNWTSQEKIGNETTGLNTAHPQTSNIEVAQFYLDQVAVIMQVYEKAPECDTLQPTNTTFAGVPATYEAKYHLWTIPTMDATYLISYAYPGIGGYRRIESTSPTPVPQSVMDVNQQLVNTILASIKLRHTTIVKCN